MQKLLHLYKRYLAIVGKYRKQYLFAWFTAIVLLTVENLIPLAIGRIIDTADGDGRLTIHAIVLLIAGLIALPLLLEPLTFHFKSRVMAKSVRDITSNVYKNVLNLDYNYHVNKQTGKMISIIINSPDVVNMFLWQLEWFVMENLASLLIPIIIVSTIVPAVSGLAITTLVVLFPLLLITLKINIDRRIELKNADYDRNSAIIDGVSNFETVRSFGKEDYEGELLDARLERCRLAMQRYQDSFRFIDFAARLNGFAVFTIGGLYMGYLYQSGQASIAITIVVISYLSQMTSKIMGMIFSFRDVIKNLPTIEDFYELHDANSTIVPPTDPKSITKPIGEINFANVSFSYNTQQPVLQDLSLTIKPNETIALVGISGGGKSTVTRLLMRYYDVDQGTVTIDGVNVQELSNESLRNLIGLVPQEPVLFNRSIFYNVGYALDDIDNLDNARNREIVEDACRKAYIHDFIISLKDGYDTVVGERGLKLSGGQKQRIAIARVLIKNPKIVIFDEATSMLDSESEKSIQLAFAELSKNKTVLIIAHRLSTITHCDNIFVIDNGQVAESGKHAELLSSSKIYKKLWDIQSGGFSRN